MNLFAPLQRALTEQNYEQPNPIQSKSIPTAIEGFDILGCAKRARVGQQHSLFLSSIIRRFSLCAVFGPASRESAFRFLEVLPILATIGKNRVPGVAPRISTAIFSPVVSICPSPFGGGLLLVRSMYYSQAGNICFHSFFPAFPRCKLPRNSNT